MRYLTTGQLAKHAGVNIDTIRFYERKGLIPRPYRKESGYRQYHEEMVKRVLFIKKAKRLGFSLRDIAELLSLRVDSITKCGDVQKKAEDKIAEIKEMIQTLEGMKTALMLLVGQCKENKPTGQCPILKALDEEEK